MMKKCFFQFSAVLFATFLVGCSSKTDGNVAVNSSLKDGSNSIESVADSDAEKTVSEDELIQDYDYAGDGWYIKSGVLSISEVYYSISNGMYVYDTPWTKYDKEISALSVNGEMILTVKEGINKDNVRNLTTGPFAGMRNITSADINLHMSGVQDASMLLSSCESLTTANVNLSGDIKYASYMFAENKNLQDVSVNIPGAVEELQYMFSNCESLTKVNLSISSAPLRCQDMFYGCKSVQSIDIPFPIDENTSFHGMFHNCDLLSSVSFNTIKVNRGGQCMFNNVNDIHSYKFAEDWDVDVNNLVEPIGDSFDTIIIEPIDGKGNMIEYHIYSKARPEWYREYAEVAYSLDNFSLIFKSDYMDVYTNLNNNSVSDMGDLSDQKIGEMMKDTLIDVMAKYDEQVGSGVISDCVETKELLESLTADPSEMVITLLDEINHK